MGMSQADFAAATWDAVNIDGKQYAVPLDTHPIVLYYNKDLLAKAGVLGEDGKPKGMDSLDGFTATLQALKDAGVSFPLGSVTADGNFMFRTIYSLMGQQDGELMTDGEFLAGDNADKLENALGVLADWTTAGLQSTYTDYPATVALFTSRRSRHDDQRRLGSADDDRPQRAGQAVQLGCGRTAGDLRQASTYADSHAFAMPAQPGQGDDRRETRGGARSHLLDGQALALLGDGGPYPGLSARSPKWPNTRRWNLTRPIRR